MNSEERKEMASTPAVIDAWIKTGSSNNGNILYIDYGAGNVSVAGGFRSVEEALKVAREKYNAEPVIDPYWI